MNLTTFGKRDIDPKLNKPEIFNAPKVPLAQSPVVARIRKTQFGAATPKPEGIDVNEVQKVGESLLSKAPTLKNMIHRI